MRWTWVAAIGFTAFGVAAAPFDRAGPAPAHIRAWRADPDPAPRDRAWAKVEVTIGGATTSLGRDPAFSVARALERQLMLCKRNSRDHAARFRGDPALAVAAGWPDKLPSRRAALYLRTTSLDAATAPRPTEVWSALISLDGSGVIATYAGAERIVWADCAPCPLYHSALRTSLPAATRRRCGALARRTAGRPPAIEPTHGQSSWAVYLASGERSTSPQLGRAQREAAALGYNALITNIGCDLSDFSPEGADQHLAALYFSRREDARAFARLREPLWWGAVRTYCLD